MFWLVRLAGFEPRDPLLRRSFQAGGQAAAFLVSAGLLIVWLQLNVYGFRPVLARGWHGTRPSMRTSVSPIDPVVGARSVPVGSLAGEWFTKFLRGYSPAHPRVAV